jgi:hypothetical protein
MNFSVPLPVSSAPKRIGIPKTTPKIIEAVFIAILALCAVILFASETALRHYRQEIERIGHDTKPTVITAEKLTVALADMDAQIANSALGNGASWPHYVADADNMAALLVGAGSDARYSSAERADLVDLVARLRSYYQLIGGSSVSTPEIVNSKEQLTLTTTLWASRLIRDDLIPRSQKIAALAGADLTTAYNEYRTGSILTLAVAVLPPFLLLITLIGVQVMLTRRTHRFINLPLAAATAILTFFMTWFVITAIKDRAEITVAKETYFDNLKIVSDAKIAAHLLKADESMWLFEYRRAVFEQRHLRQHYAHDFVNTTNKLIGCTDAQGAAPPPPEPGPAPDRPVEYTAIAAIGDTLAQCAALASANGGASIPAGLTGPLVDEVRRSADNPVERQDATAALTSFMAFLDIDRKIRTLALDSQRPKAVQLSIGQDPGQSNWAFNGMATALDHIIALDDADFDQRLILAGKNIDWALYGLDIMLALMLPAAAIGLWPRYREFR